MNANELADLLEQGHFPGGTREKAAAMLRQLQADLSDLQRHIPVKQNQYEAAAYAGGGEVGVETVMAKHCTCYKLGYSPLNDYAAVKQK
ncbi:MAG: hypothetical protein RL373_21 [Pseudomonadota bacterium]|jgi:hypothetical protein